MVKDLGGQEKFYCWNCLCDVGGPSGRRGAVSVVAAAAGVSPPPCQRTNYGPFFGGWTPLSSSLHVEEGVIY